MYLNILSGSELIKSMLAEIPISPGIYKMLNLDKQIIYIGKAKNLKKRIANYAKNDLVGKVERMVNKTYHLEYVITESEIHALLLESQLIKKFQPKFNILLKDDKSFPYIKLRLNHDYPQLIKYRGKDLNDGKYFGPYASSSQVDVTLSELQKIFKLRNCSDNYFAARKRPCLEYQIGRCYAPCVQKISKIDYDDLVKQVEKFLSGKGADLQKILASQMENLSNNLQFEKAAEIRDRIKAVSYIQLKSSIGNDINLDADLIAIAGENNNYAIEVFIYRSGQSCGNQAYFPLNTEDSDEFEVLESFLTQFYQTRIPPKEIIVNVDIQDKALIIDTLKELHKVKTDIIFPIRGNKLNLISMAYENAQIALKQHLKNYTKNSSILKEIESLFCLESLPERIEIYDNSHIMGDYAVGAMVVSGINGFEKKEYRIFNIKYDELASKGDDYFMLKQVLSRRFKRLQKEPNKKPSLIIIDGGLGHLSITKDTISEFNLNIPFVTMSKGKDRNAGKEQFHMIDRDVFTLNRNDPVMKFLQILRDEAHNFAIKNHRSRRSKGLLESSSLNQIENVGSSRKKALLNYFGSYQAIKDASLEELIKVDNISKSIAKKLLEYFRKN